MFRSMLLVPADDLHKIGKAIQSGAQAVLIDLEDSIAESAKDSARQVLRRIPASPVPVYVRVNSVQSNFFIHDMGALSALGCKGIVLPKVETAADMEICNWYLDRFENKHGLPAGGLDVIPVMETARGISNIREILQCCRRSSCASYGAGDLTADTGMAWTEDELTFHAIRTRLVIESRAAGLLPPLDTPHWEFRDMERLRASALRARQLGFSGKLCIHPAQLAVVHEVFSASEQELKWAEKVLREFAAAEADGKACITVNGQMVDYAVAKRARLILDTAEKQEQ